jgi:protein O-mannosyl-transferase
VDCLLVAVVAFACHAPALSGTAFTFDDHAIVENNPRLEVQGWADARRLVTSDYWNNPVGAERLWRPLALVTFALEYKLLGADPDHFHVVNVALHALTCVGVLLLFFPLLGSRPAALFGALLFAAHPVHAEATAGVVGRSEVLALLCVIAGLLAHRRARAGSPAGYFLAGACFFAAFTAKEIALSAPFVLLLLEVTTPPDPAHKARGRLRWLLPYLLYVLALAGYFFSRFLVLGDVFPREGARTLGELGPLGRAQIAGITARDCLLSLLAPLQPTAAHYPFPQPGQLETALTVGGHGLLLALAAWGLVRRSRWSKAAGLGVWGYYLTLGPVSNLLVLIGVVRADRLLYSPSLWTCLLLAAVGVRVFRTRLSWTVCVALTLAWWSPLLQYNCRAWISDLTLWTVTTRLYPNEPRARYCLGNEYLRRGELELAYPHLLAAAQGAEPNGLNHFLAAPARARLAVCLRRQGKEALALNLLEEARDIDPACEEAALHLAELYLSLSQRARSTEQRDGYRQRAEFVAREGTGFAPTYDMWMLLGTILSHMDGREREAEGAYTRASEQRPRPWEARFNRARIRLALGDLDGSLGDYRYVAEHLLQFGVGVNHQALLSEAMLMRGELALRSGQREEARTSLQWLQQHDPDFQAERTRRLLAEAGG